MKKVKELLTSKLYAYNIIISIYIVLLSYLSTHLEFIKAIFLLLVWFIVDHIMIFVHTPLIAFTIQVYLKKFKNGFQNYSYFKLFLNLAVMLIFAYYLAIVSFLAFYQGPH